MIVDVAGTNAAVMGCWMLLGKVISAIVGTAAPIDDKGTSFDAVSYPIEPHVSCL
jgi:hypothetical protein